MQTQIEVEAGNIFLTRADVALMLGVSPNTVARWARQGRLPCQMTLGGHRRFERKAIDDIRRRMRGEVADPR